MFSRHKIIFISLILQYHCDTQWQKLHPSRHCFNAVFHLLMLYILIGNYTSCIFFHAQENSRKTVVMNSFFSMRIQLWIFLISSLFYMQRWYDSLFYFCCPSLLCFQNTLNYLIPEPVDVDNFTRVRSGTHLSLFSFPQMFCSVC